VAAPDGRGFGITTFDFMEDNERKALAEEIDGFYHRSDFAGCIKRMDERLKESTDPEERAVALMAKSTCARHLKDFGLAEASAFAIDMESLSAGMRDYANLVRADILSATGQSKRAESLFLSILGREDAFTEHRRDVLCKAFAKLGFYTLMRAGSLQPCRSWKKHRFSARTAFYVMI
jgi:hypothetical protein